MVTFALLAATLYLLLPSAIYSYADDSLPFAVRIWQGSHVNVHHLVLSVLHEVSRWCGFGGPEGLAPTQLLIRAYVALCGAAALWTVGLLLQRWTGSLLVGLAGIAMTASTYTFWAYSIVTDFYVPAAAFALLAILFADLATTALNTPLF